ncbi:MAG TPA: VWA domain-containing protein [Thermoanaerobaculia bacterium]|nr:VWA domain-containing protein [Thermoanaerobaculia bacterium]
MKRHRMFIVAATILAGTAAVIGQERFGDLVEVTIIEVPVTVSDSAGKAVRGLTRENFELYDEGKRVPIDYFEVVDLRGVATQKGAALPAAARRNFLLLFDLANSSPGTIGRAQDAAREFVNEHMTPLDLAAVATSSADRGLKILTSFTNDRRFLNGMIATLTHEAGFKVADPLMLTSLTEGPLDPKSRPMADPNEGKAEERRQLNAITDQVAADERRNRIRNQLRNYGAVARALDRLRGQKQIILLSEGFDARLMTGREELGFQATQRENDAVLSGELWNVDSEQRFGSASGATEITEMAELFRRSDVRLHAIDVKGVRTDVDASAGVRRSSNEALWLLARPTGGTVFRNSNDLAKNFQRLVESQEVIYLLGFRAKTSSAGKFHSLRVKLANTRGEVSHRAGYFERSATADGVERVLTTAEIMMNNIPVNDVRVSVLAVPLPREGGVADVPVVVEVDGKTLLRGAAGEALPVEFFIYAFDEEGLIRDRLYQRVAFDLTQLRDRLSAAGAKYYHTLRLPPGDYSVRVLVRARGVVSGLRSVDVTVPKEGGRMVAPPLVFDPDMARWVVIRGETRPEVSPDYPFQVGDKVFVPAAEPVFASGGRYDVAVFAFNPGANIDAAATIEKNGVSRPAAVSLVGRSEGANGMEKLLLSVEAPKLASGAWDLVLTVREKGMADQRVSLPIIVR